jgi:DNA-binding IclR family transcriptional regulator
MLPGQIYLLGPQIPFLNNAFVQSLSSQDPLPQAEDDVWSAAPSFVGRLRSILYSLTEQTQEPSYLACWRYGEIVLQAIVEAPQAAKVTKLYVGYRGQAHCHALGKVLLAYSDPEIVERYLDVHPLTPDALARRAEWLIAQIVRAANHARAELRLAPVPH